MKTMKTRKTYTQVSRELIDAQLMRNLCPHSKNWTPVILKHEKCLACPVLGSDCPPGCEVLT